MMLLRRDPDWLGFAAVLAALALLCALGLPRPLELQWRDLEFRWLAARTPPTGDDGIVVVGIDDASLKQFGVPVATLHQQLGQFFETLAMAQVRAVGVDVVLPETSYDRIQPGLDAAMARGIIALKAKAPLVLGLAADADGYPRPLHPLFARLSGAEGQGLAFVLKDGDGVVRRFDERIGVDGRELPTLAGQLARRIGVGPRPGIIPMFEGQRFGYLPLHDVLSWRSADAADRLRQAFSGKLVLLGSLLAHDDLHRVPVALSAADDELSTHGVFIHAAQLRALLRGNLIEDLPAGTGMLLALLLSCSWWLRPGMRAWLGVGALIGALATISPLLLAAGWAIPTVTWSIALLAGLGGRMALSAWQVGAERRRLRMAFDGVVSPAVLKEILAGRLHPKSGGERLQVCVLFSDIRNFTPLSEHLAPEIVTDFLNRYFEHMTAVIHRHGGALHKFIGDGIMAVFGAPQAGDDPCGDAFRCAQEMLAEVTVFNREQQARGSPPIAIGVGLHFGPALVGYMGSSERHEYSAVGDTVNAASRLEGLTKELGYPIVLSAALRARLTQLAGIVSLGAHPIKGHAPIEVFGWKP